MAGVKDVAARAGVSLGTVSNVLNRPDRVSPAHPPPGRAGDGRPRLRAQRGRAAPAVGAQPDVGVRDARRGQPVLHRRRRRDRGDGRGGSLLALHVQQRQPGRPRGGAPRPPRRAARAGHPGHAARSRGRAPGRRGSSRHSRGGRRPHAAGRGALLGRRRRRAGWQPRGRAPPRPRPPADRVRRRTRVDRPGPRPSPGCPDRPGSRGRTARDRHRDRGHDRPRGPDGRRADPRAAPRASGRRRRSAPTTCWPSACSSSWWPRGSPYPTTWRSSVTTTSTSPAPLPSRSPRSASPATSSAAARPSWCSTRPDNPEHRHQQVVLLPELVARTSTLG